MKKNKKIKIIVWSVLGLFLVFNAFMVWHVLDRTEKANNIDGAHFQISRIDFDKNFDSIGAINIEKTIKTIPGVKSQVIVKRNVVVYFHDNRIADSKKVFDQLMAKGNYNAKRFVLPAGIVKDQEVCPAMKKDGFYYNYTQLVLRIFN